MIEKVLDHKDETIKELRFQVATLKIELASKDRLLEQERINSTNLKEQLSRKPRREIIEIKKEKLI